MELYELIRLEYEHGAGTVRAAARKLGVHRRGVRRALQRHTAQHARPRTVEEHEMGSRRSESPVTSARRRIRLSLFDTVPAVSVPCFDAWG